MQAITHCPRDVIAISNTTQGENLCSIFNKYFPTDAQPFYCRSFNSCENATPFTTEQYAAFVLSADNCESYDSSLLGFETSEEAVEYVFNNEISVQHNPDDVDQPWIGEKNGKIWFHWGEDDADFYQQPENELFDYSEEMKAPRTIEDLRKALADGYPMILGRNDRCSKTVKIYHVQVLH
jgi:hypothetical protein